MDVPVKLFVSSVQDRNIYYFSSDQIKSTEPHYFICIHRTPDDVLLLSCCTSQFEKRKNFIELQGLPNETLVWIRPKDGDYNPFTKDTYVDCNNVYEYTLEEFAEMHKNGTISYTGELDQKYYSQIIIGIHKSPLVEEIKKEFIPKFEEL